MSDHLHTNANGDATSADGLDHELGTLPVGPRRSVNVPSITALVSDVVCFSHLRWTFVFQRPQHLLTRCARSTRTWFIEEPHFAEVAEPCLTMHKDASGVRVAVPHLPHGLDKHGCDDALRRLIDGLFAEQRIKNFCAWYYSPMALDFTRHLAPRVVLYDCMDELSAFLHAPLALRDRETELLGRADLVFTGGHSLYEAKRDLHKSVHAFPSSVDVAHFAEARAEMNEPADQRGIPCPRIGFFGVIDERLDIELLRGIATIRPEWHFVVLGPVVKIDPATLPVAANIHYLGQKTYEELPRYLSGWDAAILPFALNESTRFISPTKTPEYLAAGRPVVSTPIRDVMRSYGEKGLVGIAHAPEEFVAALEAAMAQNDDPVWRSRVDETLGEMSWDLTWQRMSYLLQATAARLHGG